MIKSQRILFVLVLFIFSGCYNKEREDQLVQRELALLEKEKQAALRDAEYISLLKMRDSLMTLKDSTLFRVGWPEEIEGYWGSKIVCTESSCPDYVVGDLRSDTWLFSSDSISMVTKIMINNSLVRVYNGAFNNNMINLQFKTDSTASKQVEMGVLIYEITPGRMRGIRTVSVDNKCTARFNVELSRATGNKQTR
jgi:hypothetical protein